MVLWWAFFSAIAEFRVCFRNVFYDIEKALDMLKREKELLLEMDVSDRDMAARFYSTSMRGGWYMRINISYAEYPVLCLSLKPHRKTSRKNDPLPYYRIPTSENCQLSVTQSTWVTYIPDPDE